MTVSVKRSVVAVVAAALLFAVGPPAEASIKSFEKVFGEPRDDAALVYLIREKKFQGSKRTVFVYGDEELLATLENNCYAFAYIEPGERLLWLNFARISQDVELEPGRVYYYKITNFQFLEDIGDDWGKTLIYGAKFHCTPEEKEIAKSAEHIAQRHDKAERVAAKKPDNVGWGRKKKTVDTWPHPDLGRYSTLYIEDFAVTDPKAFKRKKADQVRTVPTRLANQLERRLPDDLFEQVVRGEATGPDPEAVVLEVEITQYKPGNRMARAMMVGTSNTHFDFTARVLDAGSGEELARFSESRLWAWGGAAGGALGIEDMEQALVSELAVYLEECKKGAG